MIKNGSLLYITKKFFKMLFTIWVVMTLIFFLIRLMPSNPVDNFIQDQMIQYGIGLEEAESRASFLFSLDLQKPLIEQYFIYMKNAVQLDFGNSILSPGVPVMTIIAERLPWTLFTVGTGLMLSFIVGIGAGTVLAYKRDSWYEPIISGIASFLSAIPDFLIAIFLLLFFGVITWGAMGTIIPIDMLRGNYSMHVTPGFNLPFIIDALKHGILPILTYMFSQLGIWVLLMKGSTISTLSTDYVTMAKVRGIKTSKIITSYVARNAMLPITTEFAMNLGFIVGGAIIIEQLFVYQGIGLELLKATNGQDYPLMQGIFLVMTIAIVLSSFLAELLYVILDPRIKSRKEG